MAQIYALDTESVGVWGRNGEEISKISQVSIVNQQGQLIYNKYIKNRNIKNYRFKYSGQRKDIIDKYGVPFSVVRKEVCELKRGNMLIGHTINNDLNGLKLNHPVKNIRDIGTYTKRVKKIKKNGLQNLAKIFLKKTIRQSGHHSCVEDAETAMELYNLFSKEWERKLKNNTFAFHSANRRQRRHSDYDNYEYELIDDYGPFAHNMDFF